MENVAPWLQREVSGRTGFLDAIGVSDLAGSGLHRSEQPLEELPHFRYNIVTGTWALIIATPDANKPRDYKQSTDSDVPTHLRPEISDSFDPFALANEHLTPPEKLSHMDPSGNGKKMIRVFDNKFPFLSRLECSTGTPNIQARFDASVHPQLSGVGICEVVVQHWKFGMCHGLMKKEEACLLWQSLRDRTLALSGTSGVRYVQCFENHGIKSGGSLRHPHSQLFALPFVPSEQKYRLDLAKDFWDLAKLNIFDHILQHVADAKMGDRQLFADANVVAFVPWSVERGYEFWVVPRVAGAKFSDASDGLINSIATAVSYCLRLLYLAKDDPDYNVMVRTVPVNIGKEADDWYRWHVCVLPSINLWGGVIQTGFLVTQQPEKIAAHLREQDGKPLPVSTERKLGPEKLQLTMLVVPPLLALVGLCLAGGLWGRRPGHS